MGWARVCITHSCDVVCDVVDNYVFSMYTVFICVKDGFFFKKKKRRIVYFNDDVSIIENRHISSGYFT